MKLLNLSGTQQKELLHVFPEIVIVGLPSRRRLAEIDDESNDEIGSFIVTERADQHENEAAEQAQWANDPGNENSECAREESTKQHGK